jgi:hypothetical protein
MTQALASLDLCPSWRTSILNSMEYLFAPRWVPWRMVSELLMRSAWLWAVKCCSLNDLRKSSSEGRGLTSLYELMYHTFALSLSQVAASQVCLSAGISVSSIYSSIVKAQEVTVAIDVSFPSNLSGLAIFIVLGILDCSCDSVCVREDSLVFLWGTFVSFCLWSWSACAALGEIPRARNSLEREILTVVRLRLTFRTFSRC